MRRTWLIGLSVLATAVVAPAAAQACTITWDGGAGTDRWFEIQPNGPAPGDDVYNWTPERYPTQTDDACFPAGAVASTRQVTQNTPDVRSFTISAGATLTVDNVQMIVRENSVNDGTLNMAGAVPMTISDGDPADHESADEHRARSTSRRSPATACRSSRATCSTRERSTSMTLTRASSAAIPPPRPGRPTNQGTINISAGNALRVLSVQLRQRRGRGDHRRRAR